MFSGTAWRPMLPQEKIDQLVIKASMEHAYHGSEIARRRRHLVPIQEQLMIAPVCTCIGTRNAPFQVELPATRPVHGAGKKLGKIRPSPLTPRPRTLS